MTDPIDDAIQRRMDALKAQQAPASNPAPAAAEPVKPGDSFSPSPTAPDAPAQPDPPKDKPGVKDRIKGAAEAAAEGFHNPRASARSRSKGRNRIPDPETDPIGWRRHVAETKAAEAQAELAQANAEEAKARARAASAEADRKASLGPEPSPTASGSTPPPSDPVTPPAGSTGDDDWERILNAKVDSAHHSLRGVGAWHSWSLPKQRHEVSTEVQMDPEVKARPDLYTTDRIAAAVERKLPDFGTGPRPADVPPAPVDETERLRPLRERMTAHRTEDTILTDESVPLAARRGHARRRLLNDPMVKQGSWQDDDYDTVLDDHYAEPATASRSDRFRAGASRVRQVAGSSRGWPILFVIPVLFAVAATIATVKSFASVATFILALLFTLGAIALIVFAFSERREQARAEKKKTRGEDVVVPASKHWIWMLVIATLLTWFAIGVAAQGWIDRQHTAGDRSNAQASAQATGTAQGADGTTSTIPDDVASIAAQNQCGGFDGGAVTQDTFKSCAGQILANEAGQTDEELLGNLESQRNVMVREACRIDSQRDEINDKDAYITTCVQALMGGA